MPDLESVYLRLPTPAQHLACSLVGWRTERVRYGADFDRILAEAETRTHASEEEADRYRNERLRNFVLHCFQTVPFYRNLFQTHGISPEEIRTLEDLSRLPVLTKAEIQSAGDSLLSEQLKKRDLAPVHTSGTTGGGLRFATTLPSAREQWAVWWRYRRWHGIDRGTWCALFAGRSVVPPSRTAPPFWRFNLPGRQLLFSGYHMSEANLTHYAQQLRRSRLPWLHGYPSLLSLLAAYIEETRFDLGYGPRWITTGAENLLAHQKQLIERVFGVRPRQHYGMAEAVANVSECELGALHVDEDFAAVEFLEQDDGSSRIIGTNFTNPATPFLRYDVQDLASVSGRACRCGRPGRLVDSIDGRLEDYVVLSDGTRLGRMDHIFKDLVNVCEAQIQQTYPGRVLFRIVPGDGYAAGDEEALLREARKRIGDRAELGVEYVKHLERSSTGKLRFVVSDVGRVTREHAHS